MLEAIVAILSGVVASSSWIVTRKPEAKELIDKLVPYQGILGCLLLFWSIRSIFHMIGHFSLWSGFIAGLQFVVGFLLAYSVVSKYLLSNNETALVRGQEIRVRLAQYQIPAGLALIVLGLLQLIF